MLNFLGLWRVKLYAYAYVKYTKNIIKEIEIIFRLENCEFVDKKILKKGLATLNLGLDS